MSIEENNETLKNDVKKEILVEVKDGITRNFKYKTEEMLKHVKKGKMKMKNQCDQCDQH